MDFYWLRLAEAALPGFALMAISLVPPTIGIAGAVFNLRIADRRGYFSTLLGSVAASLTSGLMLAPVLIGTDPSPMAGLRFFTVPFISLFALFVGIGLGAWAYDRRQASDGGSMAAGAIAFPVLVVLATGIGSWGLATRSAQDELARTAFSPEVLHEIAGRVARGGQAMNGTASMLAENPHTPADTLAELGRHSDFIVRRIVAVNPSTPDDVLANLRRDPNELVRQAATRRLPPRMDKPSP